LREQICNSITNYIAVSPAEELAFRSLGKNRNEIRKGDGAAAMAVRRKVEIQGRETAETQRGEEDVRTGER
jgi:hypothetical protein